MPLEAAVQINEDNVRDLMKRFQRLEDKTRTRINGRAVSAGGTVLTREIRKETPVGPTGNLVASIGKRTRKYPKSDIAVAVVGPRYTGKHKGFHAHLVHDGYIHKKSGAYVPGNPFINRAAKRAEPQAMARMINKLATDIEKEASR